MDRGMTPQSAQLGSPNAITPWTGKPQLLAGGDSSAPKENQTRRRHHKQKAKPSFFHSEGRDHEESSPNHDPASSLDASSPARASRRGKDTMAGFPALSNPSQRGSGVPMFSSQLRALEADVPDEGLNAGAVPRKRIIDTLFHDLDEPLLPAEPSEAEDPSPGSHHSGEGLRIMNPPKKKGILPMSSLDPSGRADLENLPRPKLPDIMKGLGPEISSPAPQRKKLPARKSANKSNTKMKMLALELDGDLTKDDPVVPDSFDSGNIPPCPESASVATKPVTRITSKRRAAAQGPKVAKKQATSRQQKAKQTLVDLNTHNSNVDDNYHLRGADHLDGGNDNDQSYSDEKPRPRATRGKTQARKTKESLTSKSAVLSNKDPKSGSSLIKKKTSRTENEPKPRALPRKADERSTTESSAATVNMVGSKPRPKNVASRALAVSEQTEANVTRNTNLSQQNRSSETSNVVKGPVTRAHHVAKAGKTHQTKKTGLVNPTEIQEKIRPSAKEARKATIDSLDAHGPQNSGKPRKSVKTAQDPAGRVPDPQLERGTDAGEPTKPDITLRQTPVRHHGRKKELKKPLKKAAEALEDPSVHSSQAACPEEGKIDQEDGSDMVADNMQSPEQSQNGSEDREAILQDSLDGHAEYDDNLTTMLNRHVPGNEDPAGSHAEQTVITLRGGKTTSLSSDSGDCNENCYVFSGHEENRTNKIRSPIEPASGVQTMQYEASDDSDGRYAGKHLTNAQRQPLFVNAQAAQAELKEVQGTRKHIHTGDHQSLKRPAPNDEPDQPVRPFKKRLCFPSYSQVPWVGFGAAFCVPENGRNSDDVFGPGGLEPHPPKHRSPEPHGIDPAVIERLRGGTTAHRESIKDTVAPVSLVQHRTGAQAEIYPGQVTSGDPPVEGTDERPSGFSDKRYQRPKTSSQGPPVLEGERGLLQAGMPIEAEGMADIVHQIVTVS